MTLSPEPDEIERAMVEATLDRDPIVEDGRTFWRIRKFTWDQGRDTGLGYPGPGQVYAVDVEIGMLGEAQFASVSCKPMTCRTFEKDAQLGIEHREHTEGCRFVVNGMGATRAWQFLDVRDAVLAALRWDADAEAEPFGWTRAFDGTGRVRPKGDPMLEMIGGESVGG